MWKEEKANIFNFVGILDMELVILTGVSIRYLEYRNTGVFILYCISKL
jgi:hypothetical protein